MLLLTGVSSTSGSGLTGPCPSAPEAAGSFSSRASHAPHKTATEIRALTRVPFAEHLNGRGHLLLADPLVLLALGGSLEALPGQRAQVEIHEHVAQALQVIATALFCGKKLHGARSERQPELLWQSHGFGGEHRIRETTSLSSLLGL